MPTVKIASSEDIATLRQSVQEHLNGKRVFYIQKFFSSFIMKFLNCLSKSPNISPSHKHITLLVTMI